MHNIQSSNPKRILLGQLASNGDCLYATTLARQIKNDYPDCQLSWAISTRCSHIIHNNPYVDNVWEIPNSSASENCIGSWHRFETSVQKMKKSEIFDKVILSQIMPSNWGNYDGTIRPSIFRSYGSPITVPIKSILRLTDAEGMRAEKFISDHGLKNTTCILMECSSYSGQSFVTPKWALSVASMVRKNLPNVIFILSSNVKIASQDPGIIDGSYLTMRETSALLPYCDAFAGCGSGITVIASTLEQSPSKLPIIQFLSKNTSIYASFAEDFRYWGLPDDQFIETHIECPENAAHLISTLCDEGIFAAKRKFTCPAPLSLGHYRFLMRQHVLPSQTPWDAVTSLSHVLARFGWDDALMEYANNEVLPVLQFAAKNGSKRAGMALRMLQFQINDRQNAEKSTFRVFSINKKALLRPLRISLSTREELLCLQYQCKKYIDDTSVEIKQNSHVCSPEYQGSEIGESVIEGAWDNQIPHSRAWMNDEIFERRFGEFYQLPFRYPVLYSREHVIRKLKRIWRQQNFLYNFKKNILGRWKRHTTSLTANITKNNIPTKYQRVFVGTSFRQSEIFRSNAAILEPGYGFAPQASRFTIRPANGSFVQWLGLNSHDFLADDGEYVFDNYDGLWNDIDMLRGAISPKQLIGFQHGFDEKKIPCGFVPVPTKPDSAVSYFSPPKSWHVFSKRNWSISHWTKISIVIPSYNQKKYIAGALDSIINQNYPNTEIILLDPGSTDGTLEVLEAYRDKIDILIQEPDSGQSDALERGLNLATGDILTWLCADDSLEPFSLHTVAEAFTKYKTDIIVGGCKKINESGITVDLHQCSLPYNHPHPLQAMDIMDYMGSWLMKNYFFQPEVFFSKEIWQKSGAFLWKKAYYAMDYDLWMRMALAGARITHIVPYLACSRSHSTQKTRLDEKSWPWMYQIRNFQQFYFNLFKTMLE